MKARKLMRQSLRMFGIIVMTAVFPTLAQTGPGSSGWVTPLGGTVQLKSGSTGNVRTLRPGPDARTPVFGGDYLTCVATASMELDLGSGPFRPTGCASGYPVPPRNDSLGRSRKNAILYYADVGGVTRDAAFFVYPGSDSRLFTQHVRVYWIPTKEKVTILVFDEQSDALLFKSSEIDGRRGRFDDTALTQKVSLLRANQGARALRLVAIRGAETASVSLRLATEAEEIELAAALSEWSATSDGVSRHIGLASTYHEAGLPVHELGELTCAWEAARTGEHLRQKMTSLRGSLGAGAVPAAAWPASTC